MEVDVRVFSVPHSGTRFTLQLLERAGITAFHQHFSGYNKPDYGPVLPTIIPMRDRKEVEASWHRRNRRDPNLDASWAEMEQFIHDHPDTYLLHVDDPTVRDAELAAISERLGTALEADFSVKVGHGI